MTEIHQLDESAESAAEFLRQLSANAVPINGGEGRSARNGPRRGPSASPAARAFPGAAVEGTGVQPWLSASASLPVWGAGQWLNGQRPLAMLFVALQGLAAAVFYCLSHTWESWAWLADVFFVPEQTLRTFLFGVGALVPLFAIAVVVQAYYHAARHPRARVFSGPAAIPAVTSVVVPGWGQLLNDQVGKGAVFLMVATSCAYVVAVSLLWPEFWAALDPTPHPLAGVRLSAVTLGAVVLGGLAWVVSVYDAHLTARQRQRQD